MIWFSLRTKAVRTVLTEIAVNLFILVCDITLEHWFNTGDMHA